MEGAPGRTSLGNPQPGIPGRFTELQASYDTEAEMTREVIIGEYQREGRVP